MDNNIIYSRQPKTQKLFVVFLNDKGEIKLNPGEKIVSIKKVDKFFCETNDASDELKVEGNKIKPHPRPLSSKERGAAPNKHLEQNLGNWLSLAIKVNLSKGQFPLP